MAGRARAPGGPPRPSAEARRSLRQGRRRRPRARFARAGAAPGRELAARETDPEAAARGVQARRHLRIAGAPARGGGPARRGVTPTAGVPAPGLRAPAVEARGTRRSDSALE